MLDSISEKEILPKGPEDETIPTQISKLDQHIAFLKSQHEQLIRDIAETEFNRKMLISRAEELNITTDTEYKIVKVPIYPKKHVDVEILKKLAPEKYTLIVTNLTAKAQDKLKEQMNKIQVSIAQADVKAVINDKAMLAMIIPEPREPSSWEVTVVKR